MKSKRIFFSLVLYGSPLGIHLTDTINAYAMGHLEQILKHVYGLASLKTKLRENKPAGVSDADIDINLSHYFNQ